MASAAFSNYARVQLLGLMLILATTAASMAASHNGFASAEQLRHGPGIANHPVNVIPSSAVRIPEGWPLSPDGALTCLTCHDGMAGLVGEGQPSLRGVNGPAVASVQFCAKCHDTGGKRTARAMHWMAMTRAHIPADAGLPKDAAGFLDAGSRRCMECHDGVTARESNSASAWDHQPGSIGDIRRSHPVGVPYPKRFSAKGSGPFRPASLLPPKVRLPAGQVSCVSCHDLYSTDRDKLSVSNEGSALCFACHELD